jgi:hypothetical protein
MSIPATITIDLADRIAVAQLAAVLLALAASAEKSTPPTMSFDAPATEGKSKRQKAPKGEDKPAEAPKQETAPDAPKQETISEVTPPADAPATQPEPTQQSADELRAALLAVIKHPKLGPPVAGKILADVGAKSASTVPADKRASVIAALAAAVEGAK